MMSELNAKERSLIKNSPLFQSLTESNFEELINISSIVIFDKNQTFLTEGEYSDDIYLIISGQVNLFKKSSKGKKRSLITTLSAGESIGEMRLIKDQPCSLTVETNTPVKLLCLSIQLLRSPPFQHLLNSLTLSLAKILSERLTSDNQLVCDKIVEKDRKSTQLWVSVIVIFTLILFSLELGLGFYYFLHTDYFCQMSTKYSDYIPHDQSANIETRQ